MKALLILGCLGLLLNSFTARADVTPETRMRMSRSFTSLLLESAHLRATEKREFGEPLRRLGELPNGWLLLGEMQTAITQRYLRGGVQVIAHRIELDAEIVRFAAHMGFDKSTDRNGPSTAERPDDDSLDYLKKALAATKEEETAPALEILRAANLARTAQEERFTENRGGRLDTVNLCLRRARENHRR